MTTIQYCLGDATAPQTPGPKIICHICNDIGGWGAGFVLALSRRWPKPEASYRRWYEEGETQGFRLGAVQLVPVAPELWVANMIGQEGIGRSGRDRRPPIRYDAVEIALSTVAQHAKEKSASVHMPRIGCGLAGGTWDQIEPIIQKTLCVHDIQVFVYDLA